jgi:molecular chaperone DnaJ
VDYYAQLGLTSTATKDQIKKKFYELAKKHHPDSQNSKKSDEERFKAITAAYDILSN